MPVPSAPAPALGRRALLALLLALPAMPAAARRGGEDDEDEDDRDDEDGGGRGRGRGGDDEDAEEPGGPGAAPDGPPRPRDIAVHYADGWIERIVAGRYELLDPLSRLVVARPATAEDRARLAALR